LTPSHLNCASIVGVIVIGGINGMLTVNRSWMCAGAFAMNIWVRTAAFVVVMLLDEHAGVVFPVFVVHPLVPLSEYWIVMNDVLAASVGEIAPFDAFAIRVRIASGVAWTAPSLVPSRVAARRFWSSKNVSPNCNIPKMSMASTPAIRANSTAAAPSSGRSLWRIFMVPFLRRRSFSSSASIAEELSDRRPPESSHALLTPLPTWLNLLLVAWPRYVTAAMITIAINANIKAYSTAVAPPSIAARYRSSLHQAEAPV
jgi:hypothetical protein